MKYYIQIDESGFPRSQTGIIKVPERYSKYFKEELKEEEFPNKVIEITKKQYTSLYNEMAIGNKPIKIKWIHEL